MWWFLLRRSPQKLSENDVISETSGGKSGKYMTSARPKDGKRGKRRGRSQSLGGMMTPPGGPRCSAASPQIVTGYVYTNINCSDRVGLDALWSP
jgi:hypothetical protein